MSNASMPFEYMETDIPESENAGGRKKEPNPHAEIVQHLYTHHDDEEKRGKAARIVAIPVVNNEDGTTNEEATEKELGRHKRWLREVGDQATPSYSVRTSKTRYGTKGKGTKADPSVKIAAFSFWIHTDDKGKPARIVRTVKK